MCFQTIYCKACDACHLRTGLVQKQQSCGPQRKLTTTIAVPWQRHTLLANLQSKRAKGTVFYVAHIHYMVEEV